MISIQKLKFVGGRVGCAVLAVLGTVLGAVLSAGTLGAQTPATAGPAQLPSAPSAIRSAQEKAQRDEALGRPAGSGFRFVPAATQPGPNGVTQDLASNAPMPLSLDDAISIGLERNIRLRYDVANQKSVRGLVLSVINVLVPNLKLNATSQAQEIDLAAMGFSSTVLAKFAGTGLIPAGFSIPLIVKVNTTQANVALNQTFFNLTDFELFRGTSNETNVVDLTLLNDRGEVIYTVAGQYLTILADQANVTNARAQVVSAKTLFDQAKAKQDAGVGVNIDTLRARVQYQQRQQDEFAAENRQAKDTIQLARILGLPADQPLELTDKAPFHEFGDMDLASAKATAYEHRKDLLELEESIKLDQHVAKAVRFQRLPTLAFNGDYGVIGITGGGYHGDFTAEGSMRFPVFNEAAQRGQQEVADAQLLSLRQRESDLRVTIDSQIRSAMLDVTSADERVKVAQSNVELSKQELADAQERFKAGVDDNLPAVDAEATVASAQAQLVQTLYQYNVAKLALARSTGVIETRYRTYLGN
jgi:outer membrane protein TolC